MFLDSGAISSKRTKLYLKDLGGLPAQLVRSAFSLMAPLRARQGQHSLSQEEHGARPHLDFHREEFKVHFL